MLQKMRRNTVSQRSTRVRMTCSIIVFTRETFFYAFYYGKFVHSFHQGKIVFAFQIYMYSV